MSPVSNGISDLPRRRELKTQQGFSLLEVLITLVVIAIALLGTAALQLKAMQTNQGGQFRTQAVFLVSDLAERMEANKAAAIAGSYVLASTDTMPSLVANCASAACTSSALAVFDLLQWKDAVAAVLPQSSWSVVRSVTGNPSTYTITVNWIDRRNNSTYETSGSGETFSYTATRVIFN
jgi:type IV pilus assembly protein PilV